jgi:hypothetical protein
MVTRYAKHDPVGFGGLLLLKFALAVSPIHLPYGGRVEQALVGLQWIALVPLAILGLANLHSRRELTLGAFVLTVVAAEVVFHPFTRYLEPAYPYLAMLSASWLVARHDARVGSARLPG